MHGTFDLHFDGALAAKGAPVMRRQAAKAMPEGRLASGKDDPKEPAPRISIRNLTVRFGNLLAVDNVSLDIPDGQFVSIVGPSGCGKTTVLNLLTGLLPVTEGDERLDALSHLTDSAVRVTRWRRIAEVTPLTMAFPGRPG